VGDHLWQSTLFAAVAALIALALRRQSAALRYWVWFAASAKFLVPIAALVTLGGLSSWRSVDVVPYREGPVLLETVGQPFSRDTVTVNSPRPRRAAESSTSRLLPVLLIAWAIGAAVFLTRSLMQWRRVRRIARAGVVLEDGPEVRILRMLEASGMGPKRPLPVVTSNTSLEPGVFGVTRPVLLWPRAISERLTDEQLEAVLAHELCHLRRGDNLAAVFHLAVQTIFWFHPLVWWIGARLIDERERA
jgi:beta-lactamase regulating signal transducer with metallopeptidase domain